MPISQTAVNYETDLSNFECKNRGAPRGGAALLHGLIVCVRCGSQITISSGRGDQASPLSMPPGTRPIMPNPACPDHCLARRSTGLTLEAFLDAVRPAGLETTITTLQGLAEQRCPFDQRWRLRLERARYEARMAQRQSDAVDPDNRFVARELRTPLGNRFAADLDHLEQEYAHLQRTELSPFTEEETEEVRRLAADLAALWHAETTNSSGPQAPARAWRIVEVTIVADAVTRTSRRSVVVERRCRNTA